MEEEKQKGTTPKKNNGDKTVDSQYRGGPANNDLDDGDSKNNDWVG